MNPNIPIYKQRGIAALIFDFDGTLAEQTINFALMRDVALAAMRRQGFTPEDPDLPVMEQLDRLASRLPADQGTALRAAVLDAVRRVEVDAARRSTLFPCVRPMFAACRRLGIATGIITRNCREAVSTVFPEIDNICSCLLTRDDVPRVKPHPDHLRAAVNTLQTPEAACLMVGDHPMDIAVGKAAGTQTAAVAGGYVPLAKLRHSDPDFCENSLEALLHTLQIPL